MYSAQFTTSRRNAIDNMMAMLEAIRLAGERRGRVLVKTTSTRYRLVLTRALLGWETVPCAGGLHPDRRQQDRGRWIASELSAFIERELRDGGPFGSVRLSRADQHPRPPGVQRRREPLATTTPNPTSGAWSARQQRQTLLRSGVTTTRDCGSSWTPWLAEPAVWRLARTAALLMCGPPLTVTAGTCTGSRRGGHARRW